MNAFERVAKLRELLAIAEAGELEGLGRRSAPRLNHYLTNAQHGTTLDQALDLTVGPGGVPWHAREAMAERDAAILALAKYLPDLKPSAQAAQIATWSRRYVASAWRFDKDKTDMPDHYRGTEKEPLYKALKAFPRFPKASRIKSILLGS